MAKNDTPAVILVDYRVVEGWHVFTSDQVRGLYVAGPDQREAYDAVGPSIEKLLAENEQLKVAVRPAMVFADFLERMRRHLDMPEIKPGIPQPFMVQASAAA